MARRVDAERLTNPASFWPERVKLGANFLSLISSLLLLCCLSVPVAAQVAAGGTDGPVIELGDAIILPGEDHALVPVYITSDEDVLSWQMGLEYDELLLAFDGVDYTGTVSETLNPITVTSPSLPPYFGLQVIYAGGTPLPAGIAVLAVYLKMSLVNSDLIPSGGSTGTGVGGISNEASPILITSIFGNNVIPTVIPGEIMLYNFPLYLIESQQGTALDTTLRLAIRVWTDEAASTFTMGLEYDEWIVCELLIGGLDFDEITQGEWTLVEEVTATGLQLTLTSTGGPVPSLAGAILGELIIARPPDAPGSWNFQLTDGQSFIDQLPVENLIGASATWVDHFIRGDANLDASIDISDAETIVAGCWQGVPFPCPDAADANDDGSLDISDVITVLQYLFSGSEPPPAPYPDANEDPTDDDLGCL